MELKRGQIWYMTKETDGGTHVQEGARPVVIVSNDLANQHSPVISIVPLTCNTTKKPLPTHCKITSSLKPSLALCEQVQTIDRGKLTEHIGEVSWYEMRQICTCLLIQFGIL